MAKTLSLKESDGDGDYLGFDEVTDWDPGIFGLTGSRRDLYHYDTSGAMGSINGEGRLGIFGGDKEIRGMMVDRRIWILSRSGVEIGLSANQLSDLGGNQEAFKDQRVYYGKGKGKMYEEPESKWVKVPERGSKRPHPIVPPTEERKKDHGCVIPVGNNQDDRHRYQRGARSARNLIDREREEPKEEGEIGVTERAPRNLHKVEKPQLALPESNGVKLAMSGARATAMDLEGDIGDSTEIESSVNGLEQAMDPWFEKARVFVAMALRRPRRCPQRLGTPLPGECILFPRIRRVEEGIHNPTNDEDDAFVHDDEDLTWTLGSMRLRDWDPGIFRLTWIRRDLYHYDMSGAMGSIKGEWHLGIFGRAQGIEEIRVMMVAQRIWILSRSGVEIGNSEDRARSYKGVVINGESSNQETFKDQRGYYGKGKGKMYEEPESKWVKVSERGSKQPSSYRATNRGEEERSRSRNSRWEHPRYQIQDDRNRYQRGARSARSTMEREPEEPKEEGEIGVTERVQRNLHKVEKPQLVLPESNGAKLAMGGASSIAMDLEGELGYSTEIENLVNGLEQAMDLVGNGNAVGDNVTMKLDGSVAIEGRKEELSEGVDDFQALTDEETVKTDEDMRGVAEGEEELGGNGDQDVQAGEEEKKKGARKGLV
ncbi:hypothetical protein F2Q69_00029306 [Brassica cretica]|uniref:DUF4283 domain-containing protein n=1 Tax=Brassica cretica TaxID=69181 RepID=A0A8S9RZD5_BRACR|nr:hypothetical protein F2Q69_00029306 [Brassica cretica]